MYLQITLHDSNVYEFCNLYLVEQDAFFLKLLHNQHLLKIYINLHFQPYAHSFVPNSQLRNAIIFLLLLQPLYLKTLKEYGELCKSWQYLNDKYRGIFTPQSVLNLYTDIRYQTTIEKETGTTKEGSLHNMRVIDAGTEFFGELVLFEENAVNEKILLLALKNLRFAGAKRNRGCGRIVCRLLSDTDLQKKIVEEVI